MLKVIFTEKQKNETPCSVHVLQKLEFLQHKIYVGETTYRTLLEIYVPEDRPAGG